MIAVPCKTRGRTTLCRFLRLRDSCPIAGCALTRGGLIEKDWLVPDLTNRFVAVPTGNFLVSSLKMEVCPRLVVKQRWLPFVGIVATGAIGVHAVVGELAGMRIFVAALAGDRSRLEDYILHCDFKVWRFVAAYACHRGMRPCKRKFRIGMVEPDDIRPQFCGVAAFASQRRAILPQPIHSVGKLTLVGIDVTARAGQILESVRRREVGS